MAARAGFGRKNFLRYTDFAVRHQSLRIHTVRFYDGTDVDWFTIFLDLLCWSGADRRRNRHHLQDMDKTGVDTTGRHALSFLPAVPYP